MPIATSEWVATIVGGAVVGLLVGSFLNVVVYRVPRGMSINSPPSHCPSCDARLGGLDLVPVLSWLALRGRCRRCANPISARYPLVELATAAVFAGLAAALRGPDALPSLAIVGASCLVAALIDADGVVVPRPIVLGAAIGAVSLVAVAIGVGSPDRIGWAAAGAALAGACRAVVDRPGRDPGTWAAIGIVACLGWSASWLWPIGGGLVAAWIAVAGAATAGTPRRLPLLVAYVGSLAIIAVGAVLGRP